MSTNDPMTQERLNAIQERVDCGTPTTEDVSNLLAEVERPRAQLTVDDDMVERATHAIAAHWHDMHTNESRDASGRLPSPPWTPHSAPGRGHE